MDYATINAIEVVFIGRWNCLDNPLNERHMVKFDNLVFHFIVGYKSAVDRNFQHKSNIFSTKYLLRLYFY